MELDPFQQQLLVFTDGSQASTYICAWQTLYDCLCQVRLLTGRGAKRQLCCMSNLGLGGSFETCVDCVQGLLQPCSIGLLKSDKLLIHYIMIAISSSL